MFKTVRTQKRELKLQQECDRWNAAHAVGTRVRYWRGLREGEGKIGLTRTPADVLHGHSAVVWIEGCSGCVALANVEPV